jgi:hypothetical protein
MAESTKSFKGPLEDRYYAMTASLKVIRLAVSKLRGCAAAYEDGVPEIGWIGELIRGQKLAAAMILELALDERRLRGAQRSLMSGIATGPLAK